MADVNLIVGNTPSQTFPNGTSARKFTMPAAKHIGQEYETGHFTLGYPLNPSLKAYQHNSICLGDAGVGDTIHMYVVPELHLLTAQLLVVCGSDANMAGASVTPTAGLFDATTKEYTPITTLTTVENVSLAEPSDNFWVIPNGGYLVPRGSSLVLGYKITSMPTDPSVKIHDMTTTIETKNSIISFDTPTEV